MRNTLLVDSLLDALGVKKGQIDRHSSTIKPGNAKGKLGLLCTINLVVVVSSSILHDSK